MVQDVLAPSVAKNPHRSWNDPRTRKSMSYLERSFRYHRMSEIEQWERMGVVSEALAGKTRSRRVYTDTLMSHFLSGCSMSLLSKDDIERKERILSGLWARGASQHQDMFSDWLLGAAGLPFGDVLLAQGANPHQPLPQSKEQGKTAFCNMLSALDAFYGTRCASHMSHRVHLVLEDVLTRRIEACLAMDIPQDRLDQYLIKTVLLGMGAKSQEEELVWSTLCNKLIAKGAQPSFDDGGAFFAVSRYPRYSHSVDANDIRAFVQKFLDKTGVSPTLEEQDAFVQNLFDARCNEWAQRAQRWTTTLLDAIAPRQSKLVANAGHRFWLEMIGTPGAIERGRYLLERGVTAPWQITPNQPGRVPNLMCNWTGREEGRLKTFMALVETTSVDPSWARAAMNEYLGYQSPDRNFVSNEDLVLVSKLLNWKVGALPECMLNYLCQLPAEWTKWGRPQEYRKQILSFFYQQGWLDDACSEMFEPSRGHNFISSWASDKEVFSLLESVDRDRYCAPLRMRAALFFLRESDRELSRYWIHQALEFNPDQATVFYMTALEKCERQKNSVSAHDCVVLFSTIAALREKGWEKPFGREDADLLLLPCNGVSDNWPVNTQYQVAQWMYDSGLDLNAGNARILSYLLENEESLPESMAHKFNQIMPMVLRLLELGADPSLLPPMQANGRPLCDVLYIEQQRLMMQKTTPQAANMRSRRL